MFFVAHLMLAHYYGVRNGSKLTIAFERYYFSVRTLKNSARTLKFSVRTLKNMLM